MVSKYRKKISNGFTYDDLKYYGYDNTNKHNTTALFEIGDIICGIHNNRCAITNERMKKAEVIKLYYDSLGVSMKKNSRT